jgi:hypothetical protein
MVIALYSVVVECVISEDRAASIFRVEVVYRKWIGIGRV